MCGAAGKYRCRDCQDYNLFCKTCCIGRHKQLHTHQILEFCDNFFKPIPLSSLGHLWYLGHFGSPCHTSVDEDIGTWVDIDDEERSQTRTSRISAEESYDSILIVDSSGIACHTFHFCKCAGAKSPPEQLLEAQLFPASFSRIQTAFTFKLLDDYLLDSTEAKLSLHTFWTRLQRKTNHIFPSDTPVCFVCFSSYLNPKQNNRTDIVNSCE